MILSALLFAGASFTTPIDVQYSPEPVETSSFTVMDANGNPFSVEELFNRIDAEQKAQWDSAIDVPDLSADTYSSDDNVEVSQADIHTVVLVGANFQTVFYGVMNMKTANGITAINMTLWQKRIELTHTKLAPTDLEATVTFTNNANVYKGKIDSTDGNTIYLAQVD